MPFGSFQSSGSGTVPVKDFAFFYVTGWTGQGGGFNNPCQGNGDDPVPGNDPASIVGHFIKYVQNPNEGGSGNCHAPRPQLARWVRCGHDQVRSSTMEAAQRRVSGTGFRRFLGTRRGAMTVAVATAAIAGILLLAYLDNYKKNVTGGVAPSPVLVADRLDPEGDVR